MRGAGDSSGRSAALAARTRPDRGLGAAGALLASARRCAGELAHAHARAQQGHPVTGGACRHSPSRRSRCVAAAGRELVRGDLHRWPFERWLCMLCALSDRTEQPSSSDGNCCRPLTYACTPTERRCVHCQITPEHCGFILNGQSVLELNDDVCCCQFRPDARPGRCLTNRSDQCHVARGRPQHR